jgi:trk system potassium uptake protein TrkA
MKDYAIIGLGQFGTSLAVSLYEMGQQVLCIDKDEEKINNISSRVTFAVQADVTDEKALKALGLQNFDVVVISLSEDLGASVLATSLCLEMGVKHVYAKVKDEMHAKVLMKIGAEKVIFPERDTGHRLARQMITGDKILEVIELQMGYAVFEMQTLQAWAGRRLKDLELRNKWGVTVLAIKRGDEIIAGPGADSTIEAEDTVVLFGSDKDLKRLENTKKGM